MTMHTEWDTAASCGIAAADRDTANAHWCLGEDVDEPFVLVLGGDGGGCLAVEGTREDLIRFVDRVRDEVMRLPLNPIVIEMATPVAELA